jgi:hypothetical protein
LTRKLPIVQLVFTAILLVSTGTTSAQTTTGAIAGTVTGDSGNRLSGVTVSVQNQLTSASVGAVTDSEGRYELRGLAVEGEYQVRVSLAGFATPASETVTLVPGEILVVNFRLKLSVSESVAVTALTPALATADRSVVQQTINEQLVHTLPLYTRNFIPLATLTAGFTGNPNYPNPLGQMFWSNNVVVDGASHYSKWRSGPRTFYSGYGLESIQEVQVLANRFSAEYGESLATVTRAVTRAGTDQYHGSGLFFLQNDNLNATPEFAAVNPPASTAQYGFTVGGPLGSDTRFLESYEGRRARNKNIFISAAPGSAGSLTEDNQDENLIFFRVDRRVSDSRRLMARYNGQFFRWQNEPGGLMAPGSGTHYQNDVHTFLATDRSITNGRLLSEARVQFARYIDIRTDLQPTVFISRAGYSEQGGVLGAYGFGADPEDTWEAAETLSWAGGSHAVRLGGGAKYVRGHNAYLNYGRGAYFFAGSPDLFPQPYLFVQGIAPTEASAHADPRSTSMFTFVQDDWRLFSRMTVNLGVRYDLEAISNVRNFDVPADKNNVQPRVGVAWDLFGSGRTIVRGGAGIYTQQQLLYYINRVQLEGADGTVTVSLTPDSPFFPRFPNVLTSLPAGALPPRDIVQVDPAFRNPYSVQTSAGVEQLLGFAQLKASADYVHLAGEDLMSLLDANAPASNIKPNSRTVAQADVTRPLVPTAGSFRNVVTLGNLGRSWYNALQVKVERATGSLQTVASYTLSRAEDMDNYLLPEDSRNLAAEKARADTDIRHNLTVGFTWQLPARRVLNGWVLSGIGTFRSNRPYTITWGDDRNGTTQNDARPDGRNTAETDSYQNVDVSLMRRFSIRKTTIEGRIEAFNVVNTVNFDQYVGTLLSPFYSNPVTAFPKRRVQVAAILRF